MTLFFIKFNTLYFAASIALKDTHELEIYSIAKKLENESIDVVATVFNNFFSSTSFPISLDYTIRHSKSYVSDFATNLKYRFSDALKSNYGTVLELFLLYL